MNINVEYKKVGENIPELVIEPQVNQEEKERLKELGVWRGILYGDVYDLLGLEDEKRTRQDYSVFLEGGERYINRSVAQMEWQEGYSEKVAEGLVELIKSRVKEAEAQTGTEGSTASLNLDSLETNVTSYLRERAQRMPQFDPEDTEPVTMINGQLYQMKLRKKESDNFQESLKQDFEERAKLDRKELNRIMEAHSKAAEDKIQKLKDKLADTVRMPEVGREAASEYDLRLAKQRGKILFYLPIEFTFSRLAVDDETYELKEDYQYTLSCLLEITCDNQQPRKVLSLRLVTKKDYTEKPPSFHDTGRMCTGSMDLPNISGVNDLVGLRDKVADTLQTINANSLGRYRNSNHETTEEFNRINDDLERLDRSEMPEVLTTEEPSGWSI